MRLYQALGLAAALFIGGCASGKNLVAERKLFDSTNMREITIQEYSDARGIRVVILAPYAVTVMHDFDGDGQVDSVYAACVGARFMPPLQRRYPKREAQRFQPDYKVAFDILKCNK